MKRARFAEAIDWIAFNDDVDVHDLAVVAGTLTVCLVADLFGLHADEVAVAVVKRRVTAYPDRAPRLSA